MQWASAVSDSPLFDEAVAAVARDIAAQMQGQAIDVALAFISPHHAAHFLELPAALARAIPHRTLAGCSAGGVIGGGHEVEQRPGLAVVTAHLPEVTVTPIHMDGDSLPDLDGSPRAWQDSIGVPADPAPHFIVLVDPFTFPAEDLLAGLDYAYPESRKLGGIASGAERPGQNVLYAGGRVHRAGAVVVALAGNIAVDTVVAQGCRPIGKPMLVTRAERNILLQLDGKSPLEVIQGLVEELSAADRRLARRALFLGIVKDALLTEPGAGDFLVRNIIGVDPERGALAIGEILEEGQLVQFQLRDAAAAAEDLRELLGRAGAAPVAGGAPAPPVPRGALLFSCLGRGRGLFGRPDHDTELFSRRFQGVPVGGFFASGEIGPVGASTHLHGYTSAFGIFRPARPSTEAG